jgi:hypothetical protein
MVILNGRLFMGTEVNNVSLVMAFSLITIRYPQFDDLLQSQIPLQRRNECDRLEIHPQV